ncbi:hypothetical protein AYL99_02090 [Fonsecaea erecta]|uniref:Uncharacterized protein n=1 Tax=Fonsecaea erecta TaxID=1367422 RepID=A0A178ZUG3_9EURO|nr:hypothetical protein AYL99_02090 [Fonsecaea erecta]OAP62863.1 hypothetical protein AYL99_02090 [Fonsecaea erecta]
MRHAIVVGTCLDLEVLRGSRYGLTLLSSANELIREIRRLLSRACSNSSLDLSKREDEGRFEGRRRNIIIGDAGRDADLDDDLLFAVMHLAKVTGLRNSSMLSDPPVRPHDERRTDLFKPPVFLRRMQYLHLWGRSDHPSSAAEASLHLSQLETLVALKGGLQQVKAPGFAEALHLFDIIGSAKRLARPRFEMPRSSIDFLQDKMPALRMQQRRVGVEMYQHLPLDSPLAEIFQDIHLFCSSICSLVSRLNPGAHGQDGNRDSSSTSSPPSADTLSSEDVVLLRNLVEYRLLAYSADSNNWTESVTWTSAMIFTHGVVFPLPHSASLNILVCRLREALRARRADIHHLASRCEPLRGAAFETSPGLDPDPDKRLVIWAAMMGVMATSDSQAEEERVFFLNTLRTYLSGSGISSWAQLKSILEAYLWVDWACDMGGLAVWEMLSTICAHGHGTAWPRW